MDIIPPTDLGFFIYSKSGCHQCLKLKNTLREKSLLYTDINCDEYLIEDKDLFLSFIREKTNQSINTFPIVFFDGEYIGGYHESLKQIEKIIVCFEDEISF